MSDAPNPKPKAKPSRAKTAPAGLAPEAVSAAPPPPPPPPPSPPTGGSNGGGPDRAAHVSPRLLRTALAVSVALNLLVAGVVAGAVFHRGGDGGPSDVTRDLGFGPFSEALRPEDRRALRSYLQSRAPELRSANKQRRADLVALQAALRADPFVPEAFNTALDAMRGRLEGQLSMGHAALGNVILTMPDAERKALADRLDRGMRRGGPDEGGPMSRDVGNKKSGQ